MRANVGSEHRMSNGLVFSDDTLTVDVKDQSYYCMKQIILASCRKPTAETDGFEFHILT